MSKQSKELPEDIEVIGPGQMLAEAREALKLTQKDVAQKLNFRVALVNEIEQEIFDKSLPDTFNRGYLKNYAKLVGVAEQDVLSSYEMLGVAAKQRTEMQSFSKITEKQALNTRLMWVTYLILGALVASTVVYYIQDVANNKVPSSSSSEQKEANMAPDSSNTDIAVIDDANEADKIEPETDKIQSTEQIESLDGVNESRTLDDSVEQGAGSNLTATPDANQIDEPTLPVESTAIFTFAGDCWVNIYNGNDERIAWGIKKAGYVMELNDIAPFKITVGKPELVSINFNGQSIDMSKFNEGNIAKFTLPESS